MAYTLPVSSPSETLREKIRLILSQVTQRTIAYTVGFPWGIDALEPLSREQAGMVTEQVNLLRTLFAQTPPELRREVVAVLVAELNTSTAAVVTHTLFEIADLADLQTILAQPSVALDVRAVIWRAIHQRVWAESHRFSEADLALLELMRAEEFARLPLPSSRVRGIRGTRPST